MSPGHATNQRLEKIATFIRRNLEQNKKLYPRTELAHIMSRSIAEFSGWSDSTMMQALNMADIIELDKEVAKEHLIPNGLKLGFYMRLGGRVNIVFQVR